MNSLLSSLLLGLLCLAPAQAQRPQGIEPDVVATIRLNAEGRAILRVNASSAGVPAFDLLAGPDGLDGVTLMTGGDGEGEAISGVPVLPPGRHDLTLQGQPREDGRPMEIQGRLRLDPPLDAFEPNDSREQARAIELPFHRIIRTSQGDPDWFRIEPRGGGVIGIHLHHFGNGYEGPQITVLDSNGELIYQTVSNPFAWRSMRYVRTDGRPIFVGITDASRWDADRAGAFKALEIVQYRPGAPVNGNLITLGVEADDPSFYQLDLVGEALGTRVRSAGEADSVASELARAAAITPRTYWPALLVALLLLAALAGGGFWYLRHGPGRKPEAEAAPEPEPESKSEA